MSGARPVIQVFADIACPWCYIGEARLAEALSLEGRAPEVRWRPYELQPDLPREGAPWQAFVDARFGGSLRARPMFEHVRQVGAKMGLEFNFDRITHAPNTRNAHRLVLLAESIGCGMEAARALFRAYFSEGRDVGDPEVLRSIGNDVGVDEVHLRQLFDTDAWLAEVHEARAQAAEMRVSGVPLYLFDGQSALSGAQPLDVFRAAIATLPPS